MNKSVINIGSRGETETERVLSNFARTPFLLEGVRYESVEGFWQSLKFPEGSPERERVARLWGYEAKKAGRYAPRSDVFTWKGEPIRAGSARHHELMRLALRAKLEQNPHVLRLLLETGQSMITHVLRAKDGRRLPDSKTIPGQVFSRIIMSLREEFRQGSGVPSS